MRIFCIGLNHKTATVTQREAFAFSKGQQISALNDIKKRWPTAQVIILSTCNRTEIYIGRPLHDQPREGQLRHWLAEFLELNLSEYRNCLYLHKDIEAVEHIFRVASGLDSLVPGETQIVSQIKAAQELASENDAISGFLKSIISDALRCAKRIRTETGIGDGKVSVASVALDCIVHFYKNLEGKTVLNIGAGKMNQLILQQIFNMQPSEVIVANRTFQKAEELAQKTSAKPADLSNISQLLVDADVVLTSTGASEPIISAELISQVQQARNYRPILLIDIAVPRDIDAKSAEVENVYLYNIDDLENIVAASIEARQLHFEQAQNIINQQLKLYTDQISTREVQPTLEALYNRIESIIEAELLEARNKFSTHDDADEDMEILSRALRRAMRKFCHPATENLKKQAQKGTGSTQADIFWSLLELSYSNE